MLEVSVIPPGNALAVLAVCMAIAAISIRLEDTFIGRRVSGAMVAIVLAALLANLGVIPASAPTYDLIWSYLVPLAIALFLMNADLISIVRGGGRTLLAFAFGALGTTVGSLLAPQFLDMGQYSTEFAAIFAATFTGGAINFAAVAEAVNFKNPGALAGAVAIDNLLGLSYIVLLGSSATWVVLQKWLPSSKEQNKTQEPPEKNGEEGSIKALDMITALAVSGGACAVGLSLASAFGHAKYSILYTTLMMIGIATLARSKLQSLRGIDAVAMLFMYLFFVVLGAGADFSAMFDATRALFWFVLFIICIHAAFTLVGARIFGLGHAEVVIASSACIGGPPIAVAFAALFGWRHLATAGVLTGVLGYAIGNFIGVGVYAALL